MKLLLLFISVLVVVNVFSQDVIVLPRDSTVIIGNIIVSGNKKTNTNIILREMFFKEGDTIAINDLAKKIEESKSFIFNTTLFVSVAIETAQLEGNKIAVLVLLKERWYIFPLPYFKLIDRNFNEWWVNQNHDFSRVNYGLKFIHNNVSGNNDKLNIWLITGYNRQVTLRYELPFANKKLTNGFNVGYTFSKQKEINYLTSNGNKQQFFKLQDGFAKSFSRFEFAFVNRPDKLWKHTFRVGYTSESVDDSVVIKNANYYGNNLNKLKYLDFAYNLQYTNTNYNAYPTKGFAAGVSINHRGLFDAASNLTQISGATLFAKPISKKLFVRFRTSATIKFPYSSSFINQPLFGYGDFQMRGLENYVIDGMVGLLNKTNVGFELLNFNLKLPTKNSTYKKIPFKIYGKIYNDLGYCYNPYINNNLLNNKLLHSYGFGLDIISIYDFVLKIEYSFNQLGQNGFVIGN